MRVNISEYLPRVVNAGPWVASYTLNQLRAQGDVDWVLPICSMATPYERLAQLGPWVLPPLFDEALDDDLRARIVARIRQCFPIYRHQPDGNQRPIRVIKLPATPLPPRTASRVVAFSVDTAVEEHGPHLPLATDTIQSYAALTHCQERLDGVTLARPLEYGQLTWGLPFGMSIDLTAELLTEYVRRYAKAIDGWCKPDAIYVVDVHGSIVHRQAIVEGLRLSGVEHWAFRWLHEPLAEFASQRGDQHAGGVETALVEQVDSRLLDADWWPSRIDELAEGQLDFATAVSLTPDLQRFIQRVEDQKFNGIIGDILNYRSLRGADLMGRMCRLAMDDLEQLLRGETPMQHAGQDLW